MRSGTRGAFCPQQGLLRELLLIHPHLFAMTCCPLHAQSTRWWSSAQRTQRSRCKVSTIDLPKSSAILWSWSLSISWRAARSLEPPSSTYIKFPTTKCQISISTFEVPWPSVPFPSSVSVQLYPLTAKSQINLLSTANSVNAVGTCLNLTLSN